MQVSNIKAYLAETGTTFQQLSEMVDYNPEYLRQVARGAVQPSAKLSRYIYKATNGVINLPVQPRKSKNKQQYDKRDERNG